MTETAFSERRVRRRAGAVQMADYMHDGARLGREIATHGPNRFNAGTALADDILERRIGGTASTFSRTSSTSRNSYVKRLSDPVGGTKQVGGRHPAKMVKPDPGEDAPDEVMHLICGPG